MAIIVSLPFTCHLQQVNQIARPNQLNICLASTPSMTQSIMVPPRCTLALAPRSLPFTTPHPKIFSNQAARILLLFLKSTQHSPTIKSPFHSFPVVHFPSHLSLSKTSTHRPRLNPPILRSSSLLTLLGKSNQLIKVPEDLPTYLICKRHEPT